MKKVSALNMNWDEYSEIVSNATENKANLLLTDLEWDYVCEFGYEYSVEEVHDLVGKYLEEKVLDVIIDISNYKDCVVIVIE